MDVQEEETQGNMEVTTEDPDLPRGGLGFSAGESGSYPDAGQVPLAPKAEGSGTSPPGFVRPMVQPMVLQPVRFMLDPENHAFSKLVAFRASYPSISQLLGEYAPIMHRGGADGLILPLHAPVPVRSGCPMKALRGRSKDGLGAATLKTRAAGCPTIRVHVQHMHSWLAGSGQRLLPLPEGHQGPLRTAIGFLHYGGDSLELGATRW